jgi:hypothetical protein
VNWLFMQVLPGRFMAVTETADNFAPLYDLVVGICKLLPQLRAIHCGLNRDIRFGMPDQNTWHHVGHVLAPKKLWSAHLKEVGMLTMTMQGARNDGAAGYVNTVVRPVSQPPQYSVDVNRNDHREFSSQTLETVADEISASWDPFLVAADTAAEAIIKGAIEARINE